MILKNCLIWYPRLDPEKPNNRLDKQRPSWDIQIRTSSKEQKKEWEAANLSVKIDMSEDEKPYFYVNLRKRSVKADMSKGAPPKIVDGNLDDVDGKSIGNGSIGNIRIYQYESPLPDGGTKLVAVLMGIQLTHHVVFEPKPRDDDFEQLEGGTKVVTSEGEYQRNEENFTKQPTRGSQSEEDRGPKPNSDMERETPQF